MIWRKPKPEPEPEPVKKKRGPYQCSRCGAYGHTIRSCEMQAIIDNSDYYDYWFSDD